MPLLMTLDIDGTTRRVSNEELNLAYSWFAEVSKSPYVKFASKTLHGGFYGPSFGGFSLLKSAFDGVPPRTIGVVIEWTETDESEAVELMRGTGVRFALSQTEVAYNLQKEDYDCTVKANVTGTLTSVFTTYCGASYLDRTLDTSGTSRNPDVSYNVTSDTPVIDVLSSIASFFSHTFYDDGATIYLIDCLSSNGSMELTEWDFEEVKYSDGSVYNSFIAGDYSVDGSYPLSDNSFNVSPVCHTSQTNIEAAIADIKTIIEKPGATVPAIIKEESIIAKPWINLNFDDESSGLNGSIMVQSMYWDFASYTLKLEGKGSIT